MRSELSFVQSDGQEQSSRNQCRRSLGIERMRIESSCGSFFGRAVTIGVVLVWLAALAGCVQPRNSFENLVTTSEYHKNWTKEEASKRITSYTFLRHSTTRGNEALYFDRSGTVYQWASSRPTVATGTWTIDMRSLRATESARVYICTTLSRPTAGVPAPDPSRCIDPNLLFIPATESASGDVFRLAGRTGPILQLPVERMRIEDARRIASAG